jgi:PAS domain S-box-containing protein
MAEISLFQGLRVERELSGVGDVSGGRLHDNANSIAAVNGLLRKISAGRESVERTLSRFDREAKRLSLVAANTRDTVIIEDAEHRIEWVNESFTRNYGYSLEACRGRYDHLLRSEDGESAGQGSADGAGSESGSETARRRVVQRCGKDGGKRWLTVERRPIVDGSGTITGFIVIENDITERKLAEEKLYQEKLAAEAANFAKSEFVATICHEIRNPVSVMMGMLDLALQTELTAEQREYLCLMKTSSSSLLRVVNDTLDLARIEAGCLDAEKIPFSLRESLQDALNMQTLAAQKKGLALACDVAPEIPDALLGDPMRLRQIVTNLLSNAIKFTEHGEVTMRVERHEPEEGEVVCRFSISDRGIGIPKEKQASIFEPFLQAETSTSRRYGGSGLGLTISARLVKMMGGRMWVQSEPGHGSTFFFTAQFSRQAAVGDPVIDFRGSPAREPVIAPPCSGLTILLVDDDPLTQRLAQLVLEKEGCRVLLADAAAAALALLEREHIDLVLMDVQMPGMDGAEATMAIRRLENASDHHIPVIALSAHPVSHRHEYCRQAGMDGYLTKPLQPALLRETMVRLNAIPAEPPSLALHKRVVLDRSALLVRVGGDVQLLDEISGLFLHHCAELMDSARAAMAARDNEAFANLLHTLLGMFRSLSANAAQEITERLQALSLRKESAQVEAIYAQLEQEIRALKVALASLLDELRVGQIKSRSAPVCFPEMLGNFRSFAS